MLVKETVTFIHGGQMTYKITQRIEKFQIETVDLTESTSDTSPRPNEPPRSTESISPQWISGLYQNTMLSENHGFQPVAENVTNRNTKR